MSRNWIKFLVLGVGALLLMSFLYIKTQATDLDKHNQVVSHANQFKRVDAILNQHILEIRQGLLPYYDSTVNNMLELEEHLDATAVIAMQLYPVFPTRIAQHLQATTQALAQKRELLENFKSSNAVLRNSLRYLPIAITQFNARFPPGPRVDKLKQTLNTLLRDTLVSNLNSDVPFNPALMTRSTELKTILARHAPERQQELDVLLAHVRIVLDNKKQTDEQVQLLLNLPTAQNMDALLTAYGVEYNKIIQNADTWRLALYGLSILLLAYIAGILFQLNRTAAILRQTVTDLNYQKFALDQHAIVSITDQSGIITYANQKFCDISQRAATELIGQNHRIVKSDYHSPAFFRQLWDTIAQGNVWRGQIQNQARDGSRYWMDTTIVPFTDNRNKPYQYVAIRTDISASKQTERSLQRLNRSLQALSACNENLVKATDEATLLHSICNVIVKDAGYHLAWVGYVGNDKEKTIHPMAQAGFEQNDLDTTWCDNVQGKGLTGTIIHNGEPRIIRNITEDPQLASWRDTAAKYGYRSSIALPLKEKNRTFGALNIYAREADAFDDDEVKFLQELASNLAYGINTLHSHEERELLQKQLQQAQKMEAIGQLSGGIAHDFNNQLSVVIGYLDFLREHLKDTGQPQQWVEIATRSSLRCINLTRQLLAFSRHQPREKTVVNLNTTIKEMEAMIERSLTPEVDVQYFLNDTPWLTEIDPNEFQDALLNMVINARDAMPEGGKLLIETSNKYLDDDYVTLNPWLEAGDYVQLILSDTGTGMDKETLEHVFEPFFTTKPESKGTGLGMSMVYGFAKRYCGHIKLYSEPGVGTTIRLYLPRTRAPKPDASNQNSLPAPLSTGNESILIVDDEIGLLQLADQYLRSLGYRTQLAGNAAQALEILKTDDNIDLLFSDVVMPGGMNGYELAQQASQLARAHHRPEPKVLLTSGFTSKTMAHNGLARFSAHLLSKPYRKHDLAQRIRLILDEKDENAAQQRPIKLAGRNILVVDDDQDMQKLFQFNLQKLGCTTILASNADKAIHLFQESQHNKQPIDIVILDLTLPGSIGGVEIANKLKTIDPHIKIIVASGHTEGPEMTHYKNYGFQAALEKNSNREKIRQTLERVL
ncbi:MAG: response regulator [Gammaproteobacteria bacterium]|nr:response regulator [Gammaproteobacteria bacterium]